MIENTVNLKTYTDLPVNEKEILRYAGAKATNEQIGSLLKECLEEALPKLSYKICYQTFNIKHLSEKVDLGFTITDSTALIKNLEDCDSIILFAATIGLELDRLIAKYGKIYPAKGLMLQAIGAERIEALCDDFCSDIQSMVCTKGQSLKPRFSAGYGDLPLSIQKDIFAALNPAKFIGLSLNDSMLMSPSKSVTSIVGISNGAAHSRKENCKNCSLSNCQFRSN